MQIALESEDLQYFLEVEYTTRYSSIYCTVGDRIFSRKELLVEDVKVFRIVRYVKLRRGKDANKNFELEPPTDTEQMQSAIEDAQELIDNNLDTAVDQILKMIEPQRMSKSYSINVQAVI